MIEKVKILLLASVYVLLPATAVYAAELTLMVLDHNSYLASQALKDDKIAAGDIDIQLVSTSELKTGGGALRREIDGSKVIIVDVMGRELEEYLCNNINLGNKKIYALRGSTDDERLKKLGFDFDQQVAGYYQYISKVNITNMVLLVAQRHFNPRLSCAQVKKRAQLGIYHPAAARIFTTYPEYRRWWATTGHYDSQHATIGVLFFSSSLTAGQKEPVDGVITALEQAGYNVLACFGRDENAIENFLLDGVKKPRVSAVFAFSLKFYSALTPRLAADLHALNIPVFNAINLYTQTIDQWRESAVGIGGNEVMWSIATPEISGLIEPTPMAAKKKFVDPATGKSYFIKKPIAENIELIIKRLQHLIHLQRLPNKDKKVAIMFYNHHQGKQNIGASYLNVFRSLQTIVSAMHSAGYRTGTVPDEQQIKQLILTQARNIGSWAPGELQRLLQAAQVVRLPIKKYQQWFSELPVPFQQQVIKQWGSVANSKIMRVGDNFIIPAVRLGNLVLLPEPARGWGDDPMKLYHDTTLYPHHQYLAVYLWLQHQFRADAIIHLGTHATYEWTPGKQAGLSPACPPEVLIGAIPNIYPYIVDDVGEAIQAKRRGRAVIISHLTPMLKAAGLHKEYRRMANLINDYTRACARHSATAVLKLQELERLVDKTGILRDLYPGQNSSDAQLDEDKLQQLEHYLLDIGENQIPFGLHTFGHTPDSDAISAMAHTIVVTNPDTDEEQIRKQLQQSAPQEITALLDGLSGIFVNPGAGNDPVRNPGAIPTGRNMYGFNPQKLPSYAAWQLGKKAAEQIIANHLRKHKKYPAKVAVVLWATETLRNEGINESTILYLMGIKPRWSATGRVLGLTVIPRQQLGRPRIDVMINASGLYRDLFPDKIEFLHQAVQLAIRQSDLDNVLAHNTRQIELKLREQGIEKERAREMSRMRVFSEKPGSYGNGVAEMAANSAIWEKPREIVDVFERRTGFAFGGGRWGTEAPLLLRQNLAMVDVAVHSRSSNLYGLLDNDDMFQYLGGLSMAVRHESGSAPESLIVRQQRAGQLDVEDVAKNLGREIRSRYLNLRWIKAMQREGYAGARAMANYVEYLWGWDVTTPQKVTEQLWQQSYAVYVKDKYKLNMKEFFNNASPWARQSISARMLEAVRKQYWHASKKIQQNLAVDYAVSVIEKGVACCDHTCNNPLLNQMVVSIISLPGVMTPQMVAKFKLAVEQAAQKTLQQQVSQRRTLQKLLTASAQKERSAKSDNNGGGKTKAQVDLEGYKMEKITTTDERSEITSSGVEWLAGLAVLLIVVLGVYGARRTK